MIDIGDIKKITGAQLDLVLADETELTIESDRISMNGLVLDNSTSLDGQFTIGAAVTGQLTITLLNADDALSVYNFRDATAQLTFIGPTTIPVDEDDEVTYDDVIVGQYNIADYTYDGSNITLAAYDNLCKLDVPCNTTNGTTVSFPITTKALVTAACTICGITLANSSDPIPNGTYSIASKPHQWDTMTWHDVISYCAQIGGVYAKVDKYGRLYFDWYNISVMTPGYDGGTFDTTTTPYSDGDDLDGGDFDYDGTEDDADGGTFNYPPNMHVIPSPYALTIDTDDVYITGLKVVLEASDNINADENTQKYTTAMYGTDGYVITISGNPLIQTTTQADSIKDYLGAIVVGMWFRPLTATIVEDPTVEAGDQAYITGRNGNTYQCFISHVTYTTYASTIITCDAEPVSSNLKTRFTAADKLASHVERVQRELTHVSGVAGNTNQYFWHTEIGTDTGAHITEVPQDEWNDSTSQYYHSGGNLLARSNGIAVRNGLTELSQFRGDGIDFYDQYGANVVDIDTNCASFSSRFTYSEQNNNVQSNVPWVLNVREKSPYFADFTSTWYLLHVEINGVVSEFVHPWTADFTETVTSSGKTTTIDYSYADGTITFTYVGNTNPIWIYAYPQWSSSIVSSAFTFGTRSGTNGAFSGTIGVGLKAEYETQIVFGRYNSNNSANMLEVGGGEADGARINLLELKKTSGNLKIKGSLTQGSDRRLKEHKAYLDDDAIQFIRKLKPAYYIKDGEDHVGFYAQDVAEADPWHSMTGESDGYMTLCYTEIIAPLVKYCQSLEKRIAELEGK